MLIEKVMIGLFAAALLVLCTVPAFAQDTCTLKLQTFFYDDGSVKKSDIHKANVTLKNRRTGDEHSDTSSAGFAVFKKLPVGEYDITVTKKDFKQSVDVFYFDCSQAVDKVFSYSVPMWKGETTSTIDYATPKIKRTYELMGKKPPEGALKKEEDRVQTDENGNVKIPLPIPGAVRGVVNGSALKLAKPKYPVMASLEGASGAVQVWVLINEEGHVTYAEARNGHEALRAASENAAMASIFRPTLLSGMPVKVWGQIVYNFAR